MAEQFTGRLAHIGGGPEYHFVSFRLEYGRAKALITIEVEGPAPPQGDLINMYTPLLHRLGVVAQQAAASPQAPSWPDPPQSRQMA